MKKRIVVVAIPLIVGALHFVTGESYQGPFPVFVNGYLIDILLPMTLFILMGLIESKVSAPCYFAPVQCLGLAVLWKHHSIWVIRSSEALSTRWTSSRMQAAFCSVHCLI